MQFGLNQGKGTTYLVIIVGMMYVVMQEKREHKGKKRQEGFIEIR